MTKTIHTDQGTFIIGDDMEADFDPASMLPEEPETFYKVEKPAEPTIDTVTINGKVFSGRLKVYRVTQDGIAGKTIVRVVLEA